MASASKGRQGADLDRWKALASKELRGKAADELHSTTPDGIRIKPLYTAADLEELEGIDSIPGAPPFLR